MLLINNEVIIIIKAFYYTEILKCFLYRFSLWRTVSRNRKYTKATKRNCVSLLIELTHFIDFVHL